MSLDAEAGALEEALGGVDRAGEHEHRVDADEAGVDDPGLGREPELLGPLGGHQQHGGGAVGDLRGGAGGVDAVGAGHGLELGQLLEGGLAQALVSADGVGGAGGLALLVHVGGVDRHDLGAEAVLGPGLGGELLRPEAEASVSSRVMPHLSAMRSAPSNWEVNSYWGK